MWTGREGSARRQDRFCQLWGTVKKGLDISETVRASYTPVSTESAAAPKSARYLRSIRRSLLPASALAVLMGASAAAGCSHDWDAYDPRLGDGGSGGTTTSMG